MERKLVYTPQAKAGLDECMSLLENDVSDDKLKEIRKKILDRAEILKTYPFTGQEEPLLKQLEQGHRRIIQSHYKIINLVEPKRIIVTDIFTADRTPKK